MTAKRCYWESEIVEIELGTLVYLVDGAPTLRETATGGGDRVVVVWGRSSAPTTRRDRGRLAGFIPVPRPWSGRGRNRGHLVANALGGGLDLNLVPQSTALNRGRSEEGRRWRAREREAAAAPGTPLFVRPIYADATWSPTEFEYGLVRGGGLHVERFQNRPYPGRRDAESFGPRGGVQAQTRLIRPYPAVFEQATR